MQNRKTGLIEVLGDYRHSHYDGSEEMEVVIDWSTYYPHSFKSPFAAYLIPNDISVGERVFIEDLIEDFIDASWSQGDNYRLESCVAIWNGSEPEIQYNPSRDREHLIG